ncbi:MAG: hypothetical protein OXH96_11720 [Spirochaetaceae bacterium]|nr:hypothetical protein [Spirochaetaceae bacterium]
MAVAFDTLKAATRLQKEAGFDETTARVLVSTFAEGMVENLATKDDIAALRREIATLATKEELAVLRSEVATKEELAALRSEVATKEELAVLSSEVAAEADIAKLATKEGISSLATRVELETLRGEMKEMGASLRAEIGKVQERMTVRLGGAIAAAVAVLVAVDKLL